MSGEDLFAATLACELSAPNFFLLFLLGDECLERGERYEPEAVNDAAVNEFGRGQVRDVIRRELDNARCIARAQVRDAIDYQFAGGHEQTTWLQDLQSVRCLTL